MDWITTQVKIEGIEKDDKKIDEEELSLEKMVESELKAIQKVIDEIEKPI